VGGEQFGPNTAQVEAFLERLTRLTPAQWEKIMEAAPGVGAIPDLEVKQAPDYFRAFEAATRIAKSEVFPGSESAFYEAMRQAQLVTDARAFATSPRSEAAGSALIMDDANLSPEAEAEAITRLMSTAYEEEGRRRVMNACMMAAGALVVRNWLTRWAFDRLYAPIGSVVELKTLLRTQSPAS
jgi:hypothetical protein